MNAFETKKNTSLRSCTSLLRSIFFKQYFRDYLRICRAQSISIRISQ